MRAPALLLICGTIAASSACTKPVDLSKALQIVDVSTGWFDAGIVEGQNKLVPFIAFRLKNVSDQTLNTLQVNALFRHGNDKDEWGSAFLTAAGTSGLAPGGATPPLTMKSQQGYKGTEPRQQMLQNSHFVDAKVELSAKYGSGQWTRIGDYQIERKLVTP
jgi:hypothetical protein